MGNRSSRDFKIEAYSSTSAKVFSFHNIQRQPLALRYIYLRCDPETSYERLKIRSRSCESSVPLGYLQALHSNYESFFEKRPGTLVIDAEQDKETVLGLVKDFLHRWCTKILVRNDSSLPKQHDSHAHVNVETFNYLKDVFLAVSLMLFQNAIENEVGLFMLAVELF